MKSLIETSQWDVQSMANLAELALSSAAELGASAAEVGLSSSKGLSVNVRLAEVDTLEYFQDRSLSLTVYKGQSKGSANTSDFSKEGVRNAVQAACAIARFTAADEYSGLANKENMAAAVADLDLYHAWDVSPEQAIDLAKNCESVARETEGIENSEGASVSSYSGYSVYANSHGFVGGFPSSRHSLSCSVIAGKAEDMQRDYWYSVARSPEKLQSAQEVGLTAAQRTLRRLGARKIGTTKAPVLYSAELARSLLGHFIAAIRGSALYRQSSFLLDRKGDKIFPDFVAIKEQPHIKQALGSAPFDSEGVATVERDVVSAGILNNYVLDSYSARRLGLETTGNAGGVHNLVLQPGKNDQAALLKKMGTGLLVTELMGHGVNIVTGDYSRGASGFWVENGEIQYPVQEITIAGNLQDMFSSIVDVGSDLDTRSNIRCGSVLIEEMSIAGE